MQYFCDTIEQTIGVLTSTDFKQIDLISSQFDGLFFTKAGSYERRRCVSTKTGYVRMAAFH